ncbi:MAG: hypothetical protein IT372_17620 [Polyangiaceae bacterium]|nr:hypothetical protein [Polyangiaceae bacterium]
MRRNAALLALISLQALVVGLSALFHLRARVAVLDAFLEYGTAIPRATQVALSPWLVPVAALAGTALALAAAALPLRRSRRNALAAAGLFLSGVVLVFAVCAAFVPVFRPE